MSRGSASNASFKETTSLPKIIKLFKNSEILKDDLNRVDRGHKLQGLDIARYRLQEPNSDNSENEGQEQAAAWDAASDNSKVQLEHMELSLVNQELMEKYSVNAWRYNVYQLDYIEKKCQEEIKLCQEETLKINRLRKSEQLALGEKLLRLEAEWKQLINSTLQVDLAVQGLEAEILYLKQQVSQLPQNETA
ncbi:hypothetical protein DSO57_1017503 [Entomophthora muscae]|nr:hypothetical protein DSO57_1017503 [Entomophthora muscae]